MALLGFRPLGADGWRLRLVVSTEHWTRETLEESLDLACCIEVASDEIERADAAQRWLDVAAGVNFLGALVAERGSPPIA